MGGAAYFREFATFGVLQWFMFPFGILMTLSGVVLLSARDMSADRDEREFSIQGSNNERSIRDADIDSDLGAAEGEGNGETQTSPDSATAHVPRAADNDRGGQR